MTTPTTQPPAGLQTAVDVLRALGIEARIDPTSDGGHQITSTAPAPDWSSEDMQECGTCGCWRKEHEPLHAVVDACDDFTPEDEHRHQHYQDDAEFVPANGEPGGIPVLRVGGVGTAAFIDPDGTFTISIHTDEADSALLTQPGDELPMTLIVNGVTVASY
ncbi:hypothetical protein [Kitasatospora sp. NPDC094016]|uniref:hypothetical protein n=1 Tax=Kitasatospora sp. NPDC094016 TaxID=3154986 RepID=UPI0033334992